MVIIVDYLGVSFYCTFSEVEKIVALVVFY